MKTLLDADTSKIVWTPKAATLSSLTALSRVSVGKDTPRMTIEEQVVSIPCTIVAFKREDDGDVHLLMQDDSGNEMIAEVPDPAECTELGITTHVSQFTAAQNWVATYLGKATSSFKTVSQRATITGMPFQDFPHGQRGEAPNSMEIHPVLSVK